MELKGASRFTNISSKLAIVVCGNLERALPREQYEEECVYYIK